MSFIVRSINIASREQALQEIALVGADAAGALLMAPKAVHRVVKVYGLMPKQANILKQEMLSKGGEVAVARGVVDSSVEKTDVLLMGTLRQYRDLIKKLRSQPFGLARLVEQIQEVLDNLEDRRHRVISFRKQELAIGGRTLIMGILNVTPDSFSDGGLWFDPGLAVEQAHKLVADGADIIDLGGESTRPGHIPVGPGEELRRVMPVLEVLVRELNVPVSVDTFKASVARQALEAGASIINDQWALRADPDMAGVIARYGVPVVLMHNQQGTQYHDLMGDIVHYLEESISLARSAGVPEHNLIVDPGIGFGKTLKQNLEVMGRMSEIKSLGKPILLGTSRKSMIGKTLDLPIDQRVEGTAATVALGIANGADIVRVHDVKEMARVARMTDAMLGRTS